MTFPQNTAWGHLGVRSSAQFALMSAVVYTGAEVYVDDGTTTLKSYFSDGVSWNPILTTAEAAAVSPVVLSTSTADADANSALIAASLSANGQCLVVTPGVYTIGKTIDLRSYTRLITAPGVELKLASGVSCNMVRNYYAQQIFNPTTRVSIAGTTVTFIEPGHNRSVGEQVYIENTTGNTSVNGLQTITALTGSGDTYGWKIVVGSSAAITNPATSRIWVGRYNAIPAANITRTTTTASVTWTSAAPGVCTWTAHGRGANDPVTFSAAAMPTGLTAGTVYYVTPGSCTTNTFQVSAYPNGPALTTSSTGTTVVGYYGTVTVTEAGHRRLVGDHIYITGATGANTFNGPQEISGSLDGVSWTYVNPGVAESSSTVGYVAGDTQIFVDVWRMNYDADNHTSDAIWGQVGLFVNVGNSEFWFRNVVNSRDGGVTNYNMGNCKYPVYRCSRTSTFNSRGGLQFSAASNNVLIGTVDNSGCYDDTIAWGFSPNSGAFGGTASPSGSAHMGVLRIDRVNYQSQNTNSGIKFAVADGYSLGSATIGEVVGRGCITVGDPGNGTAGYMDQLIISNANNTPFNATDPQINCQALSRINKLEINSARDNTSGQNYFLNLGYATQTIDTIILDKYQNQGSPTNIAIFCGSGTLTVNNFHCSNSHVTLGPAGDFLRVAGTTTVGHVFFSNIKVLGPGNSGNLVATSASGTIQNAHFNSISGNCNQVLIAKSNQGTTMSVLLNDVHCNTAVNDNATAQAFNIYASNLYNLGNNSTYHFVAGGSGAWKIRCGPIQHQAGFLCSFGGTTSVSISGIFCQVDLGASGAAPPARLVPAAGDILYNTNATGPGLYAYKATAVAAWTLFAAG